jgi:hypothetical protein
VNANVNEPNIDILTVVGKLFGNLEKYQNKKSLQDLVVLGMTIKEFWQHSDKDYMEFEYGKSLVPKQVHVKLSSIIKIT